MSFLNRILKSKKFRILIISDGAHIDDVNSFFENRSLIDMKFLISSVY